MFQECTEITDPLYSHAFSETNKNKKMMYYLTKEFWRGLLKLNCVLSDNDRAEVLVLSTSMTNVTLNIYLSHTFLPPTAQKSPARKAVSKSVVPMDSIITNHGLAYRTKINVHKLPSLIMASKS